MLRRIIMMFVICLASATACLAMPPEASARVFPKIRAEYRLDLGPDGTLVVDRASGAYTRVPFGERMLFADCPKYSKDTGYLIRHVRAHAEVYREWKEVADLPVDFLRTGALFEWDDKTARQCREDPFSSPHRFPDRPGKVVTAYVNMGEFSHVGGDFDYAFDPAWDLDGDCIIDTNAGPLPDYVDVKVFNAVWKGYVAAYWTDSWREELKKKIDLAAVENFDGLMLDSTCCYNDWEKAYPSVAPGLFRQRNKELIAWISNYAKEKYGSAFLITLNLDKNTYQFLPDLAAHVDGGYYQNAFFSYDGSAVVDGYCRSALLGRFKNPAIDFIRSQGLSVLDVDHLGTGQVFPGLNFKNYDDRITEENLLKLFRWAIDSGSTPYAAPVFLQSPYGLLPRFTRVLADLPPFTDTPYNDWVIGSEAADNIATGAGDDLIYGGAGDDIIDGGEGSDTVLYPGKRKNYEVSREGATITVIDKQGDGGTDLLRGIERLIFANKIETVR